MRQKRIFYTVFLYCSSLVIFSQNRTWLTYEIGQAHNSYEWMTDVSNHHIRKGIEGVPGIYLEQEFGSFFSLEIGYTDRFYGFDIDLYQQDTIRIVSAANNRQFPIRGKARINLINKRLYVVPFIGMGFTFNSNKHLYTRPIENYNFKVDAFYPDKFIVYQSGISLEYLLKNWKFGFYSSYNYYGKDLISYSVPELNTKFYSNGNYMIYQLRIGYAISSIWKKKSVKK